MLARNHCGEREKGDEVRAKENVVSKGKERGLVKTVDKQILCLDMKQWQS